MISLDKVKKYNSNYGEYINVDGKNMCVKVMGNAKDTIILLPGMGCYSPVYEFTTFANILSKKYKVVIIENFGYGLSDLTDKERTIENIADETHCVLEALGIKRYTIMAHSIWGIYALYYVEKYSDEVVAYAGIDSTFPKVFMYSGQNIKDMKAGPSNIFEKIAEKIDLLKNINKYTYNEIENANWTENDIKLQKKIIYTRESNITKQNEIKCAYENLNKVMEYKYNLPVIFFLAEDNIKSSISWQRSWEEGHRDIIGMPEVSKIEILEGGHYLHYKHAEKIAEDFDVWYKSLNYNREAE